MNASAHVTVSSGLVGASVAGSIATAIAVRAGLGPLGSDRLGRNLRDAIVNSHVDVDLALALDAAHGHLRVTIAPGPPLISALQAAFGADRVAEAGDAAEIVIERPGLRVATKRLGFRRRRNPGDTGGNRKGGHHGFKRTLRPGAPLGSPA